MKEKITFFYYVDPEIEVLLYDILMTVLIKILASENIVFALISKTNLDFGLNLVDEIFSFNKNY